MNLFWVPGWQFSAQAFQGIWQALSIQTPSVLEYADTDLSLQRWLDWRAEQLPEQSVLIGWSLGGMLAYELARRSVNVKKVFVICTNTRFSGGPGLPKAVADKFLQRYQDNPDVTRKKFSALVDRERNHSFEDELLDGNRTPTLQWLYELEISDPTTAPVHVLLAENDQLVPEKSARLAWQPLADSVNTMSGEHSLPIVHAQSVADWILANG